MKKHVILLVLFFFFENVSVSFGIDDARLKDRLTGGVFELVFWKNFDIKSLGATDEQLYRVLMDIYREAEDKWPTLTPGTTEWGQNRITLEGVLGCLPLCGNVPVKDFLLDYAVSKEKESGTRTAALSSYLRVADAEEAKEILLRFLVGENRDDLERLSVYGFARMAYDESDSPEKKAAILAALAVAADKEEGKIRFMKVDGILAERSAAYRQSSERLAMLERHSQEPPTANLYTDRDLKAALEESHKYKRHTNINTNLAAVMSRYAPPVAEPPASPPPRPRLAVPLAVGVGVLAALALLATLFWRKR